MKDDLFERMLQGGSVKAMSDEQLIIITPNMTAKQCAAIRLKVPCSGDPELDAAIRQSRRAEFAKAALAGNVFGSSVHDCQGVAEECFDVANYMLAEWEKEAK
jgi:hypothetical protein